MTNLKQSDTMTKISNQEIIKAITKALSEHYKWDSNKQSLSIHENKNGHVVLGYEHVISRDFDLKDENYSFIQKVTGYSKHFYRKLYMKPQSQDCSDYKFLRRAFRKSFFSYSEFDDVICLVHDTTLAYRSIFVFNFPKDNSENMVNQIIDSIIKPIVNLSKYE